MSGLLGNLVTQIATSALSNNQPQQAPQNAGLGGLLGSVLGGMSQNQGANQQSGFGLDDVLGGVLASQMNGGNNANAGAGALGSILSSVLGGGSNTQSAGSGKGMLLAAVLPMILGWIQKNGGLSGALSKVQSMGLGQQAQSWMSTEQGNINLDQTQVSQLFDSNDLAQVSQQTGFGQEEVCQGISELLPEVMNQLTPEGGMQHEAQANQEIDEIMGQLSAGLNSL